MAYGGDIIQRPLPCKSVPGQGKTPPERVESMKGLFRPKALELLAARPTGFSLTKELAAGITVGLIALPLALALGIASIPTGTVTPFSAPALGIITAIVAG